MQIKRHKININELDDLCLYVFNLLKLQQINQNFICAGGFARFIANKLLFNNKQSTKDYFNKNGDIDLFYVNNINTNNKEYIFNNIARSIDFLVKDINYKNRTSSNESVFSRNVFVFYENDISPYTCFKFQFIDFIKFNSIEELFKTFDLENSKWVLEFKNNNFYLCYTDTAYESDLLHHLTICDTETNQFLAGRLYKYIKHKNCEKGLNLQSIKLFNEFIMKPVYDNWNEDNIVLYNKWHNNFILTHKTMSSFKDELSRKTLERLIACNLINKNNLSFLLLFSNRWSVNIYQNYNIKSEDWSIHNIKIIQQMS